MIRSSFEFVTNEFIQVGSTNKNCLRTMPNSTKKSSSFVIGDDSGTISSYEYSKGKLNQEWKTSSLGKEISRIELAGPMNARDRIFYSGGTMLRGVRKGKDFWKLDTNLTETIKAFGIEDTNSIWTAGDYLLNEFEVGKERVTDKSYFLSPDKINDVFIHSIVPSSYNPILACQDKSVRVIEGEEVHYSYTANGAVNCIHPFSVEVKNPASKKELDRTMVFGLGNGSFINVSMEPDKPVYLWSVGVENNTKKAGISLIKVFDFQARGINDVILVRDDSTIEFHAMNSDQEFELLKQTSVTEGVTGLDAGYVTFPGLSEFVISTYSGKVIGYCDQEEINKTELKKTKDTPKDSDKKIKALRAEIDKLKQDLDVLKAETPSDGNTNVNVTVNSFKINYKIVRNTDDASYSVHIDSQYPIEIVGIQSLVKVELLEVDSHIAILSVCPEDTDNKYALSATYRFVDSSVAKFEIKLRTIEGQYGDINCFVIPNANPKTCQAFNISLKPLSLHERHSEKLDLKSMTLNYLKITGTFSKSDIHSWISTCLPDMPQNVSDDETTLTYKSSYVGSFLVFSYQSGLGEFYSESISTITILKDVISLQASNRSVQISISWDINNNSVVKMIELLAPKFSYYQSNHQKYQLLIALKELSNQEGNNNFLSKDSKKILEEAVEIEKLYKSQPKKVEYLKQIITDLYTDKAKANGNSNIQSKLSQLGSILNNFDSKSLLDFFKN